MESSHSSGESVSQSTLDSQADSGPTLQELEQQLFVAKNGLVRN